MPSHTRTKKKVAQECIPVGCVPPAAVAVTGVVSTHPQPDPPEIPPWLWAWTRSPSISPLAVGLHQIPLNFPLGCGPGPDPTQLPPWQWAWRPPRSRHPPRTRHPPKTRHSPHTRHPAGPGTPSGPGTLPVDRILDTRF